jgi:pimeloyl-ACP methyl ester carboxylesterase
MSSAARSPFVATQTLRLPDGRALSVRHWPAGCGEPLVLLHGMLDSSDGWNLVCRQLSGTCLGFDLPGFGYSDPPPRGSITGYARDITDGLDMLGVDRMTLVGHSLGGAVAAAIADQMPERVRALVLLSPAGFGRIPLVELASLPVVRQLVGLALPYVLSNRAAVAAAYLTMVTNGSWPERELLDRVTGGRRSMVDGVKQATLSMTNASRRPHGLELRRARYRGPVRVVWGDCDRLIPRAHSDGVLTAFPQARIDVWPGMGHHHARERIGDLIDLIEEAIAETKGQGGEARRLRDAA